jgi:hypothetical protein
MEGQTDAPSEVGDTVTEHVRTLRVVGKLRWITVVSARPWRFVVETTAVEMPLMRRARPRITYAFEPPKPPLALDTRMVRTLEYEFTGIVRVLTESTCTSTGTEDRLRLDEAPGARAARTGGWILAACRLATRRP